MKAHSFDRLERAPNYRIILYLSRTLGKSANVTSDALKQDILAAIAKHDGEWYWYQLDRRLIGLHPPEALDQLLVAVNELAASGLSEVRPNPRIDSIPRYWLTDAGRSGPHAG